MLFPAVAFRLDVVPECSSTQELLLARRGTAGFHGSAVLSLRQTEGRGRRGREWTSPEGNLALSFAVEVSDDALPLLPFVSGLALHEVVLAQAPRGSLAAHELQLKWPNDLYLRGGKLAGLLAQGRQVPGRGSEVVVGIGLNLRAAPPGLEPPAVALGWGEPETFARALLARLAELFAEVRDFETLRARWEPRARLGRLRVVGETEPVTAVGLAPTGELLLEGGRRLASEEVSVRQ